MTISACSGYDQMVRLLVQHGADVNRGTTALDNTALFFASHKCNCGTVKMLLDAGANPWHVTKVSKPSFAVICTTLLKVTRY